MYTYISRPIQILCPLFYLMKSRLTHPRHRMPAGAREHVIFVGAFKYRVFQVERIYTARAWCGEINQDFCIKSSSKSTGRSIGGINWEVEGRGSASGWR